jgi:outer membrane protein assembly factor BamA
MKRLLPLSLFFLLQAAWAQEDVSQDTVVQPVPIIEKLFNTADHVLDWVSGERWAFIPAVTYSPETRLGLGIRAIRIFRPEEGSINRPSTLPITFLYTLNKQMVFSSSLDLWINENADHLSARIELSDYPFEYYGFGNDQAGKQAENYASKKIHTILSYQKRLGQRFYIGPQYAFKWEDIYQLTKGGLLDSGQVPGSGGQRISGLGLALSYDTRSNIFQPDQGAYHQVQWMSYQPFLGSQFSFTKYVLDFRKYIPAYKKQALAVQAWYSLVAGNAPFQEVSLIGGSDVMRGYFEGSYRDRHAMVYQSEYRVPVHRKLGVVFFGSAGQVANRLSTFSLKGFRYGGGLGFRYRLTDDGLNLRLDLAYGNQTSLYFGLNEVL